MGGSVSSPQESSGKQTGRRIHDTVKVTKFVDKTTPLILKALCNEDPYDLMEFHMTRTINNESEVYMTYKMYDVLISESSMKAEGYGKPVEMIGLDYSRIETKYIEFDERGLPMGTVETCWDIINNNECLGGQR